MTNRAGNFDFNVRYNKLCGAPGTPQILPLTGTSARSTVLYGNSAYTLISDTDCFILYQGGATDNATSLNMLTVAGERFDFTTPAGSSWYLSAIQKTSAGNLYLAELSQDRVY